MASPRSDFVADAERVSDVLGVEDEVDAAADVAEAVRKAKPSDRKPAVKSTGRKKINIEYIEDRSRRHVTFSKRKSGLWKKAYELSTLTGTQVMVLVASERGNVFTFSTSKLKPALEEVKDLAERYLVGDSESRSDEEPAESSSSAPSSSSGQPRPDSRSGSLLSTGTLQAHMTQQQALQHLHLLQQQQQQQQQPQLQHLHGDSSVSTTTAHFAVLNSGMVPGASWSLASLLPQGSGSFEDSPQSVQQIIDSGQLLSAPTNSSASISAGTEVSKPSRSRAKVGRVQ